MIVRDDELMKGKKFSNGSDYPQWSRYAAYDQKVLGTGVKFAVSCIGNFWINVGLKLITLRALPRDIE